MTIPSWQRLLALLTYLLPWSDGLPFGRSLTSLFPVLQWLSLPALPLVLIEQAIPFGGFILFLVLFLGVVRNQRVPYFIRFNALQAILLDIILIVLSLAFNLLLAPWAGTLQCGPWPTPSSWGCSCWCCSGSSSACAARKPTSPACLKQFACSCRVDDPPLMNRAHPHPISHRPFRRPRRIA